MNIFIHWNKDGTLGAFISLSLAGALENQHVYIKPRSLHLNEKVEPSHKTDAQEFHQLIDYTDDSDIRKKLQECKMFCNRQLHWVSDPMLL